MNLAALPKTLQPYPGLAQLAEHLRKLRVGSPEREYCERVYAKEVRLYWRLGMWAAPELGHALAALRYARISSAREREQDIQAEAKAEREAQEYARARLPPWLKKKRRPPVG